MNRKRNNNYDRVMSRVFNNSRTSFRSDSVVMRHEVPSSVRVGAKPSTSNISSCVYSDLPTVLNDYVPEDCVKKTDGVKKSNVVMPKRTLKSVATSKSPPRTVTKSKMEPRVLRAQKSTPVLNVEEWSDSHIRKCYSSRSHTKLKELKEEIKAYQENERLMRLRSNLYKKCGVVFDDYGHVASDKAVQAEMEIEKEPEDQR